MGERAVHLRRRLSIREAQGVGPVCDVRTTDEGARRFARAQRYVPAQMRGVMV